MYTTEQLADFEQLRTLKSRYFHCLDHKDWDGWRDEIFCADATLHSPEGRDEAPVTGIDNIIPFVEKVVEGAVTVHHGHMPDVKLTSADTASGVWAMEDLIWWPEDKRFLGQYTHLHGFGHYRETYEREARGWRIKTLLLTRLHLQLS